MLAVICPVFHRKVPLPLGVKVADAPAQIVDGDTLTLTLGNGLTNTVTDAPAEQPLALVPVTEYVVVELGLTTMLAPVCPVFQT
jgi:hypothetical protein